MWVLTLIAVVMISYLLARMTSLLIAGQFSDVMIVASFPEKEGGILKNTSDKAVDVGLILKRNFFDAEESQFASEEETASEGEATTTSEEGADNQVAVKTSLSISLISTVSVGNGENPLSSCVIESGKQQGVYKVASQPSFAPDTKIIRILPKRVEFLNKDRLEYVELVDFAKGLSPYTKPDRSPLLSGDALATENLEAETEEAADVQQDGNRFQIPRSEVEKALENLSLLYTEIRAVPYFKDGKANGFKLISVKQSSLFEKLGLKRGDILKSINGNVLDIQSGLKLFTELKNETSFILEVERRGTEQSFYYDIIG